MLPDKSMLISQRCQGNDSRTSNFYQLPDDETQSGKFGRAGSTKSATLPQIFSKAGILSFSMGSSDLNKAQTQQPSFYLQELSFLLSHP